MNADHRVPVGVSEPDAPFALFVDAVKDYAIVMLDATGHVVTWNTGAERIKGYRGEEIIGQPFTVFYTPEDQADGRPKWLLAEAERRGCVEDEGWRVRKGGGRFWANVVITAVRDSSGQLLGFGKVTRDMTQARVERAQLESAISELRQANEALETFSRSMTHDIKGPLRTIQGFAEVLATDFSGSLDAEGRDYVDRMHAGAQQVADLVESLVAYFRMVRSGEVPAKKRVSVDDAVAAAIASLTADVERTSATIRFVPPLGSVIGYWEFLLIVLDNLIGNALKFVSAGTKPEVTIVSERHGAWLRLSVKDNGIGISEDEQRHLFEPFHRLHARARYAGSGLGLASVAQAVKRMGGRYGVESAVGRGSCFWIDLPAA